MFKDVLRTVVERTEGGIAALLMGFDGITVDNYRRGEGDLNIENLGMEYSVILNQIRRTTEALDAGVAHEVIIRADNMLALMRILNRDYFVVLVLKADGNLGKARFLLRVQLDKLLSQLI